MLATSYKISASTGNPNIQNRGFHMSHEKNLALLSIESWLFDRDPYNGVS